MHLLTELKKTLYFVLSYGNGCNKATILFYKVIFRFTQYSFTNLNVYFNYLRLVHFVCIITTYLFRSR
jgi:hypothetical protein